MHALFLYDPFDSCCNGTQVTMLGVRIDVEDRLAIVMIDDLWNHRRRHLRHIAEQLGLVERRVERNWSVFKGTYGVDITLRSLCRNHICQPHFGIDPKIRLYRCAGTQRDIDAVRNILLSQPELTCPHAVNIQLEAWSIDYLVHINICRTGDSCNTLTQPTRNLVVRRIEALNLYVNRRRYAKVQNLSHDIGRLEGEGQIRVLLLQLGAQLGNVISRWMVILL